MGVALGVCIHLRLNWELRTNTAFLNAGKLNISETYGYLFFERPVVLLIRDATDTSPQSSSSS